MIEAVLKNGRLPDETKRACEDCRNCKGAVTWWCTSDEAIKARNTSFPGVDNCPYWVPCRTEASLSKKEKRSLNIILI